MSQKIERMIYTARQLEDLWKANGSNGQVVLPYRARLTPMASDWIKSKRIQIGYSDLDPSAAVAKAKEAQATIAAAGASLGAPYLWWCDGPCGTAKAALMGQAKEAKDRKSTRLNSSHSQISYAVFCLKKK